MISSPSPKVPAAEESFDEGHDDEERPTIVPAFDPEALARDSEIRARTAEEPDEEERPTIVPAFDPEALARSSELSVRPARTTSDEPTLDEARRLLQLGEPEQALLLLTRLLEVLPLHAEASSLSDECRSALERQCLSVVGSLSTVLVVAVTPEELLGFGLDHLSGFLLSLIDGATDVETVLDLCGRPRLLALGHLRDLVARGIVQSARRR